MPEAEWLPIVRERAIDMMMAEIRNDLMRLNVMPDVFFSERSLIEGEELIPSRRRPPMTVRRTGRRDHRLVARAGPCL